MILLAALYFLLSSPVLAQDLSDSAPLPLQQEESTLNLRTQVFETLYRTDQVPDTCYRDEVQGSRNECRTEYDRQCDTRYEQDCRYRSYPVCQQVMRPVCYPQQVCHTVMDNVCNSRGCQSVPRRVCQTQNQCRNQWDTVCHNDQRYECQSVPQTVCQNVPRQVCQSVPNVVRVPYACQRPVQVPIGQRLSLETLARVQVRIANLRSVGIQEGTLEARLIQGKVVLKGSPESVLVRVIEESQSSRRVGETQAEVDARFTLELLPVSSLNALPSLGLNEGRLEQDRIEFRMNDIPAFPLKGRLLIVRKQTLGGRKTVVNSGFDARALVLQGGVAKLMLAPFGVECLKNRPHEVSVQITPDVEALKKGLVNPETLARVNTGGTELRFEDRP